MNEKLKAKGAMSGQVSKTSSGISGLLGGLAASLLPIPDDAKVYVAGLASMLFGWILPNKRK